MVGCILRGLGWLCALVVLAVLLLLLLVGLPLQIAGKDFPDVPYHANICGPGKGPAPDECIDDAVALVTDYEIGRYGWSAGESPKGEEYVLEPFYRSWLEYNAAGEHSVAKQKEAILKWIDRSGRRPIYTVVYVHGWHHNAKDNDEGSNAVKFNNLLARHADQVRRHYLQTGKPPDSIPVVLGIYVGWQGERTDRLLTSLLSIDDRSKVADDIGKQGNLAKDLREIAETLRARNAGNRIMVIGHSLGGRMLTEALLATANEGAAAQGLLGPGSLVVTVNAAVNAVRYRDVLESPVKADRPTWVNITSTDDVATSTIYFVAGCIGLVDADKCVSGARLTRKTIGHYVPYLTHRLDFEHKGQAIVAMKVKRARSVQGKRKAKRASENCAIPTTADGLEACALPDTFRVEDITAGATGWFNRGRGEPEAQLGLAYPRFLGQPDCPDGAAQSCFDSKDADMYVMTWRTLNPKLAAGRVWNISTTRQAIDFETPSFFKFSTHNGYVSTNLTRILVELLFSGGA